MRQPAKACNGEYACSQQPAFRLSTYAQNTSLPFSSQMRTSPSPCNVRLLFMTTHHLAQMTTLYISQGCLVAIAGYYMIWSQSFCNQTRPPIPIKADCCTLVLTITHFRSSGRVFAARRVGMHFPDQILVGYLV
jgi:hypothetical protein